MDASDPFTAFQPFPKLYRLYRNIIVTEKIDGTNAQIIVNDTGDDLRAASSKRFITPEDDNFGFACWADENKQDLLKLGPGQHFGEWWGAGIQRRYGLDEKRFSLFNVMRWGQNRPSCCGVVPVLYQGPFDGARVQACLLRLAARGSVAAPGFEKPEGVVVFHTHSGHSYKYTCSGDGHKGA